MAIKVKDPTTSAAKYAQRAQAAAPAYATGVSTAGQLWQTNTLAAEPTWVAGVQDAVTNGRFANGVNGSSAKYQANASGVGAQRYGPGVAAAGPAWQKGVTPYLNTIAALTLPPRQPKGNPANYTRSQMVGDALRALKVSL